MAHELDAPAPVVASSGPSRRAITIAAVIFAILAATALTWAKCWPYASKTAHVLTNAFGGISILTEGGRTPGHAIVALGMDLHRHLLPLRLDRTGRRARHRCRS